MRRERVKCTMWAEIVVTANTRRSGESEGVGAPRPGNECNFSRLGQLVSRCHEEWTSRLSFPNSQLSDDSANLQRFKVKRDSSCANSLPNVRRDEALSCQSKSLVKASKLQRDERSHYEE